MLFIIKVIGARHPYRQIRSVVPSVMGSKSEEAIKRDEYIYLRGRFAFARIQ